MHRLIPNQGSREAAQGGIKNMSEGGVFHPSNFFPHQ